MISQFTGTYSWLSNFWPAEVKIGADVYPTVEHAYQASKTTEPHAREMIRLCGPAGVAKRLGRALVLRPGWAEMKLGVMEELLRQKFEHPHLRKKLIATYPMMLEEGNRWNDKFWGVHRGKGKNHLGRLIMQIRSEIMEKHREDSKRSKATNSRPSSPVDRK